VTPRGPVTAHGDAPLRRSPAPTTAFVVSCEHGGNRVPSELRAAFAGQDERLASHRGWDPGALPLARGLASALDAPLHSSPTSRLIVDLNRSAGHPRVFSEVTRALDRPGREALLERLHTPWRAAVEQDVAQAAQVAARVVHLSVHSFTPVLDGQVRKADLSLLYDPARAPERDLAHAWVRELARLLPDLSVRRNDPYRGTSDGLTSWLRRRHPSPPYLGIEIEVNQRLLGRNGRFPARVPRALVEGLRTAVAAGA